MPHPYNLLPAVRTGTGRPACASGETFVNGVCTRSANLLNGMVWNGIICTCPIGQEFISGECQVVSQSFAIGGGISGGCNPMVGHGFLIEVINWIRRRPFGSHSIRPGNRAWIAAQGAIDGSQIAIDAIVVDGGHFPPHFNATAIKSALAGERSISRFPSCDHAIDPWTSNSALTGTMTLCA